MHALHEVLHAFLNLHTFTLAMPDVWAGFQVNLRMMVVAEVLVLVFALMIAVVRGLPGRGAKPLRALAIAYTDFFRGTPIIIVAFFIGFGLPGLQLGYISNRSFTTYGIITLTLVYTAYVTEVYRAGIESVHASQRAAAVARAVVLADDAVRDRPAGSQAGHSATPERLHRVTEGHVNRLRDRRDRSGFPRPAVLDTERRLP